MCYLKPWPNEVSSIFLVSLPESDAPSSHSLQTFGSEAARICLTDHRLLEVSNFGDSGPNTRAKIASLEETRREEERRKLAHARGHFARPTAAITKIWDYSQSRRIKDKNTTVCSRVIRDITGFPATSKSDNWRLISVTTWGTFDDLRSRLVWSSF